MKQNNSTELCGLSFNKKYNENGTPTPSPPQKTKYLHVAWISCIFYQRSDSNGWFSRFTNKCPDKSTPNSHVWGFATCWVGSVMELSEVRRLWTSNPLPYKPRFQSDTARCNNIFWLLFYRLMIVSRQVSRVVQPGQDTSLSPRRPGFKSRHGNSFFYFGKITLLSSVTLWAASRNSVELFTALQ